MKGNIGLLFAGILIILAVFLAQPNLNLAEIAQPEKRQNLDACSSIESCDQYFSGIGLKPDEIAALDIKCGGGQCTIKMQ